MPPRSAAIKLRESFGDRKLPEISRRITACVACRKLKIKCCMGPDGPPCERCRARNTSCTINKSLQTLLENDATWQADMEDRVSRVETILREQTNLSHIGQESANNTVLTHPGNSQPQSGLDTSISLGAFPSSSIPDLSTASAFHGQRTSPDLLDRALLSLDTADQYFLYYQEYLDECLHYLLEDDDTLTKIRSRSSLLLAAICAVSASCNGLSNYKPCLEALKSEVASKLFATEYTFDDVRALCIGAYWLTDIAVPLSSLAVRLSTQLDLHRCLTKMPHSKRECYTRTRLYYIVCLCDHLSSLTFGRPPLTTALRSLRNPSAFLNSKFSTRADTRLIGQLELCLVTRKCFDTFGADITSTIVTERSSQFHLLHQEYEAWYNQWHNICVHQENADSLTRLVCDVMYESAKLFLFAHAFRDSASIESEKWKDLALGSALAIATSLCINGVRSSMLIRLAWPLQATVAFASVILMRALNQPQAFPIDRSTDVRTAVDSLADMLCNLDMTRSSSKILRVITQALEPRKNNQELPLPQVMPMATDEVNEMLIHPTDFDINSDDLLSFDLFNDVTNWTSIFTQNDFGGFSHFNGH